MRKIWAKMNWNTIQDSLLYIYLIFSIKYMIFDMVIIVKHALHRLPERRHQMKSCCIRLCLILPHSSTDLWGLPEIRLYYYILYRFTLPIHECAQKLLLSRTQSFDWVSQCWERSPEIGHSFIAAVFVLQEPQMDQQWVNGQYFVGLDSIFEVQLW